jgi:hypothetical protein
MTQLEFTIMIIDAFKEERLQEQNISIGLSSTGDGKSMCKKGCSTCCTIIITKGSMEGAFLHKYNK